MKLTSKALRMARVKWITQFYLLPTRFFTNGMSHPAFTPSRRASPHFGRYSFSVSQRVGGWISLNVSKTTVCGDDFFIYTHSFAVSLKDVYFNQSSGIQYLYKFSVQGRAIGLPPCVPYITAARTAVCIDRVKWRHSNLWSRCCRAWCRTLQS